MDLDDIARGLETALDDGPRGACRWFGTEHGRLDRSTWSAMGNDARQAFRRAVISNHLYAHLYCYGRFVPDLDELTGGDDVSRLDDLALANQGGWIVDPSWVITDIDDEGADAEQHGLRSRVALDAIAQTDDGPMVLVPTSEPRLSPGFFMVRGRNDLQGDQTMYRFYLSMAGPGRAACMRLLTERLNEHEAAFRFKVSTQVDRPHRADAAVLYVGEDHVETAVALIEAGSTDWRRWLVPTVPTMTKPLAPGIGFAQDPGGGRSFGESRCEVLADAWLDWRGDGAEPGGLIEHVRSTLDAAGFEAGAPHLNAGGQDVAFRHRPTDVVVTTVSARRSSSDTPLIDTAIATGEMLLSTALRHGGRVQWIGAGIGDPTALASTLEPDLYGGLAGVALFLAHLASAVDDRRYASAAVDAMHTALDQVERSGPTRGGFYTGSTGVLAVAAEVAELVDRTAHRGADALRSTADRLLVDHLTGHHLTDRLTDEHLTGTISDEPDLLLGLAGEIIALLRLATHLDRPGCVTRAIAAGDALVAAARPLGDGIGWEVSSEGTPRFLAGLTHGGAGIAAALLRLHEVDPDTRWNDSAHQARVGEDTFYRKQQGNWLDARAGIEHERFSSYWCHGLPGILVSRVIASRLDPDDVPLRAEVDRLVATLTSHVSPAAPTESELSLCHGLTGSIDILRFADPRRNDAVESILASVAEYRGSDISSWPHGLRGGANPSLLTGHAGIGLCYLGAATGAQNPVLIP